MDRRKFIHMTVAGFFGGGLVAAWPALRELVGDRLPHLLATGGFQSGRSYLVGWCVLNGRAMSSHTLPIQFRPHAFETFDHLSMAIEKAGPNGAVLDRQGMRVVHFRAPDGLYFYGHAVAVAEKPGHFLITAYRSEARHAGTNSNVGFLVEAIIDRNRGQVSYSDVIELPGFIPHDIIYADDKSELLCTIKNDEAGYSKVLRMSPDGRSVLEEIRVGQSQEKGVFRNVTHLYVREDVLYFSFNEHFGKRASMGGGVGRIDLGRGDVSSKVLFETSFTELLRSSFPGKSTDSLDIQANSERVVVTLPGCQAVAELDLVSREFTLKPVLGISGISYVRGVSSEEVGMLVQLAERGFDFVTNAERWKSNPFRAGIAAVSHLRTDIL